MRFEHFFAGSIEEAISLLDRYGEEAMVLAGGTELLINLRHHAVSPRYLVSLKRIPGLDYVEYQEGEGIRIGALTLLRTIERSPELGERYGILSEAARSLATLQIRNAATIGGNICQTVKCPYYNQSHVTDFMRHSLEPCFRRGGAICQAASEDGLQHSVLGKAVKGCIAPTASDMATPLIALGGSVKTAGPAGERLIPLDDFFLGAGETALKRNEILTELILPEPPAGAGSSYLKYSPDLRAFPAVNVAAIVQLAAGKQVCKEVRLVLGGVAPRPLRPNAAEEKLRGEKVSASNIEAAARSSLEGARASGPSGRFKLKKAEAMVEDALRLAFRRAGAGEAAT